MSLLTQVPLQKPDPKHSAKVLRLPRGIATKPQSKRIPGPASAVTALHCAPVPSPWSGGPGSLFSRPAEMGRGRSRRGRGGSGSASGRKRPRRAAEVVEEAEMREDLTGDYCFACKDGGELRVCDFRSCNKAYHPDCVGKDSDFLTSDEEFICEWHTCFICKGRSSFYCFCCPLHAFCKGCVAQAEFVPVLRKTKGFCINCLRLAIMIEKNVDVDSDGERADFSDRETYEFLFKEYWKIVKYKEGLTLDKLEEAYAFMKRSLNCKKADLENIPDEECSSDSDFLGISDDGDDEECSLSYSTGASKKIKAYAKKEKLKNNGNADWGSEALIEFLSSVGKDTSNSLDQFGAAQVVKEYIQKNDLLQKDKKMLVLCDERLKSLFRKSKLRYNRICSLLEKHITANVISEDETLVSSEDNNDLDMTKKARTVNHVSSAPKRTSEINKKCFASLVPYNIKLIYLKRSLVMDLLKEPDTFESKVTGCFVRVKNDPKDYCFHMHGKLYQLGQVIGVRRSSEEYKMRDISTNVLLCISNMYDVKISMLSNDDFEEDECIDLRLLGQKGSFKRPTVAGLEEKEKSIRRDIIGHWIDNELQRLEKQIELASEKGWRDLRLKYMSQRNLLREPSERQRLLEEVPQVIPDIEDSKDTKLQVTAEDKSTEKNAIAFQATKEDADSSTAGMNAQKENTEDFFSGKIPCAQKQDSKATKVDANDNTSEMHVQRQITEANKANTIRDTLGKFVQNKGAEAVDVGMKTRDIIDLEADEDPREIGGLTATIDLEADDARGIRPVQHETNNTSRRGISPRHRVWYYVDPQGEEQGPFKMEDLRTWWHRNYFPENFKVWREGETRDSAVFLRDVL